MILQENHQQLLNGNKNIKKDISKMEYLFLFVKKTLTRVKKSYKLRVKIVLEKSLQNHIIIIRRIKHENEHKTNINKWT